MHYYAPFLRRAQAVALTVVDEAELDLPAVDAHDSGTSLRDPVLSVHQNSLVDVQFDPLGGKESHLDDGGAEVAVVVDGQSARKVDPRMMLSALAGSNRDWNMSI
jgi:hypothetical protein